MAYASFFNQLNCDSNSINLFLRVVQYNSVAGIHKMPKRKLYDFQVVYVEKGSLKFDFEKESLTVGEGQAILIPPDLESLEYKEDPSIKCNYYSMHFDLFYIKEKAGFDAQKMYFDYCSNELDEAPFLDEFLIKGDPNFKLIDEPVLFDDLYVPQLSKLFDRLTCCFYSNDKNKTILEKYMLFKILLLLDQKSTSPSSGASIKISDEFCSFVENEYMNKIDISQFALNNGYSPNYFRKIFTKDHGLSPNEYLKDFRLNKAARLIKEDCYIFELAQNVGYPDPFYFSKCFKRKFGLSPKEFKEKVKYEKTN